MAIIRTMISVLMMLALAMSASALIQAPQNTTYGPSVPIALTSETATNLSYAIGDLANGSCEDCASYTETITLPDGTYTLIADDEIVTENVTFSVLALDAFGLYDDGTLYASSNKNADLSYSIDEGDESSLCDACSEDNVALNLDAGDYTITVFARNDLEEANETFDVTIATEEPALEIDVSAPLNTTYVRSVPVSVETNLEANLSYSIDDGDGSSLCDDCTQASRNIALEAGHYTILIEAERNGESVNTSVSFTITDFSVSIISPKAQSYDDDVLINISASEELDSINVTLDGESYTCSSCESLVREVELEEGTYTLRATGYLEGAEERVSVVFTVDNDDDSDDDSDDRDDEPRFTTDLNKLPQAVESGEYTDGELASIIRDSKLNPGVLNRLIKTGMLGEESIDAILETQYAPPGIFYRLFWWAGWGTPSSHELVAERYNISEEQAQRVAVRDDIPPGIAKKVIERVQERERYDDGRDDDDRDDRSRNVRESRPAGSQNVPPGLAKKDRDRWDDSDDDREFEGYVRSVNRGEGTFTLTNGLVFHVDARTEFEDDIGSLEELEEALENDYEVEAEGDYRVRDSKNIVIEVELETDDDEEREFEGYVRSVNRAEGTFTLTNGLVLLVNSETEFDDDIGSLEELEEALENDYEVEAEGDYIVRDERNIVIEVELETDDDDSDSDSDDSNDDDTDEDSDDDDRRGRGPPQNR